MVNPVLTVTYIGFVNNEGPAQLIAQAVATTTGVTFSPVGKYPIIASGAASPNYSITYLPGTLTVKFPLISVPNTFTPNGDGINDTWSIRNIDVSLNYTAEVFNRYGQRVYFTTAHPFYWDGRSNGAELPSGIYYYVINLKSMAQVLSGSVTIIR